MAFELETDQFVFFWGSEFSQWYDHEMTIDGVLYGCAEQYMMAMKAKTFNDEESYEKIMATQEPSRQKALGRKVKNFDPDVWNRVAKDYVFKANLTKFSGELKSVLLGTGNKEIVEASPYDTIWGIGMGVDNPDILDRTKWRGTNWLGEVLMKVRSTLR